MGPVLQESKLIVVDIESTCWMGHPPQGQHADIIEIGYCIVELLAGQVASKGSIFCIPSRSTVDWFCTKLTGITDKMLQEKAVPFSFACQQLRDMGSLSMPWMSFGEYDQRMFEQQCRELRVPYPFGKHYNLKEIINRCYAPLAALVVPDFRGKFGLDTACTAFGIGMEGRHHSGADDAHNAARQVLYLMSHLKGLGDLL